MKLSKQSFSLIEVIASLVILEVVLVSILGMFTLGSRSTRLDKDSLIGHNLMQWKIEEIKAKPFAANLNESGTSFTGYPGYTFSVNQTTPFLSNAFLKYIYINVNWTTPLGVPDSENFTLIVADK